MKVEEIIDQSYILKKNIEKSIHEYTENTGGLVPIIQIDYAETYQKIGLKRVLIPIVKVTVEIEVV